MATLGSRIGVGRQAEVYAWDEGRVLKLFYPQTKAAQVEREASLTKAVVDAGLPVPRVFETVQIGDRHGFVMSRVEGPSMFDQLGKRPWGWTADGRIR